jgi:hypothetical protein
MRGGTKEHAENYRTYLESFDRWLLDRHKDYVEKLGWCPVITKKRAYDLAAKRFSDRSKQLYDGWLQELKRSANDKGTSGS